MLLTLPNNSIPLMRKLPLAFFLFVLVTQNTYALPIDWSGTLGYDTNIISNVRRTTDDCSATDDSYCPGNDNNNARYQSYVLRLNPNLIVNDSATIKGELSTGAIRGGFLGQDTQAKANSYYAQTTRGSQAITANQLYLELYADSALYRVGKYAKGFGLGAYINNGENSWDRYFSLYDGIEAEFRIGKFLITPIYSRTYSPNNGPYSGKYDTIEMAISGVYSNPNNNLEFGLYYGIREVETSSNLYGANTGPNNTTLIDLFVKKSWENFGVALEVPMLKGEVGTTYGTNTDESIDANAFIFESYYDLNSNWRFGLDMGSVSGEDGSSDVTTMNLHPNYQIAQIMFRYNLRGFQDPGLDIFESSINNANYAKLYTQYKSESWEWKLATVMANAQETANSGSSFYNQETNTISIANADQSDELGMEIDLSFRYEWNPNIFVTGFAGYYMVGDFYSFTNGNEDIPTEPITASGFSLDLRF